ncbi:A24 family peptidase [Methylobacterium sp. J-048]|uniref:prepilin peptidase n=1 Tax=Methylobacterium sp. J-048 TaxID=2836635 RepID=UPI001FBBD8D1|nr:A24 family peptidase [Methylobacterium sp. J-048]MCJ2058187.1 A24 family peptidase [Methylobacterium sp. J-048]
MVGLTSMMLAVWFAPAITIFASLTAGLLAGRFVDRVIVQLPAAMKRAWEADVEDSPSRGGRDLSGPDSPAAGGDSLWPHGPSWRAVRDRGALVSVQTAAPTRGHEPVSTSARASHADPERADRRVRWRRPFVQLVCGVAFALLAARFGLGVSLFAALAATAVLITLAFIDWDHHLLPDILVLPLLGSGLLVNLTGLFVPPGAALLGAIVGYGSLWLLARAYRLVFGRTGIGAGDLKLMAALGAWLGWRALLPLTQLAAGLALAATFAAMLGRPRDRVPRQLPYGTYMAVAGWLLLVRHPL